MESTEPKKEEHTEHAGHSESKPAEHHVEHHPEHHPEHHVEHHSTPVSSPKKKADWKTILFAVIAVVLLIIIILMLTNVINLRGASQSQVTTKELLNLTYDVYSDNALLGSDSVLAEKGSLSNTLGLLTTKLDTEINKMSAGEEKNITLAPEDAYGDYDSTLIFSYPRVNKQDRANDINRTAWIAITSFTSTFNEQPIINKIYNLSSMPWPYKVLEVNATHAKISQEPTLNQEIPYGLFTLKVSAITNNKITLRIEGENTIIPTSDGDYMVNFTDSQIITTLIAEVGQELQLTNPETGETLPLATVLSINDTHLVMDENPPYAGKTLIVQVKLIEKKTEKSTVTGSTIKHIEGAPTMQVFIMSHCPYGAQIVKGLLPVWEKFQSKANIELRFVSYTMHGPQEDLDNNRILCIREEQSTKLLAYLNCFAYGDGSEASSQSCITSTGVDKTKLDSCVTNNAATYMKVDTDLNTQYGVQGSPTIILDGKEASVYPRDPASVAKALCDAFSSKPSECSFSFDTTNPSPGFGGGTASSSGSAASCG